MKNIIKERLRQLSEARVSLSDMGNFVLLFLREDNIFLIIDPKSKTPMGYISFGLTDGDVYGIYGAYAKKGFGPILYELAMTYVYPKGITMSDDSTTSDDALGVWEKFYARTDVEKKPIIRKNKTEKEELLQMHAKDGIYTPEQLKHILKLHNTQFIYNVGKSNLDKLIKIGDSFMEQYPDINYMRMVYSLES